MLEQNAGPGRAGIKPDKTSLQEHLNSFLKQASQPAQSEAPLALRGSTQYSGDVHGHSLAQGAAGLPLDRHCFGSLAISLLVGKLPGLLQPLQLPRQCALIACLPPTTQHWLQP